MLATAKTFATGLLAVFLGSSNAAKLQCQAQFRVTSRLAVTRPLIENSRPIVLFSEVPKGLVVTRQYRKSGLTRTELLQILELPVDRSDAELLFYSPARTRRPTISSGQLYPLAVQFVAKIDRLPSDPGQPFKTLAEYRYSLLRDLFTQIYKVSRWEAADYAVEVEGAVHHIFRAKNLDRILVIDGRNGNIRTGSFHAMKDGMTPDDDYFSNSEQLRFLKEEPPYQI